MKFTYLIAIFAISALALNASAYNDGTLRRQVAQNDVSTDTTTININTAPAPTAAPAATQAVPQPTTTVEAQPATMSKAELIRKARVDEEVHTEQKIVEKLEDSRLNEEKERADRLFGNKLDTPPAQPAAAVAPAPLPLAPAPAPVAPAPAVQQDKPTQVTIEKVEIVQPEKPVQPAPETSVAEVKDEAPPASTSKFYVSGLVGNLNYGTANVHSNYALGVAVGEIIDNRYGIELGYMYSNHNIDDLWSTAIYHTLDQSDFYGAAKYYFMTGKLKPYVGGSLTYINRKYTDKLYSSAYGYGYYGNNLSSTETTQAIDAGVLGGVDFAINDSFAIGAGADYNFNVMNMTYIDSNNLPPGAQALEKIGYWTLKVTGKFTF